MSKEKTKQETKFERIIEGWTNLIWKSPNIEKLAKARASLCALCKHNKVGICVKCGCPISAAVRSLGKQCPVKKW